MYRGGVVISSHGPPKTRGQPPVHRAPRERSAAAPAVCGYSMRRFLPTAGASSSITEAEVHLRFEEIRSYLYAKGRGGEYSETEYLLSKAVHSFTHETQVKRRGKERGEVEATIRDLWKG